MKDENFFTIQGWMRNKLNLKGNELLVYAIIYGFSQDGESEFTGSLSYISGCTGMSRGTAINTLRALCEKEFISKKSDTKNQITLNSYKALICTGGTKIEPGGAKIEPLTGTKIVPNNIIKNIKKLKYGEFKNVHLSEDESKKLAIAYGISGTEQMIERLSSYKASSGRHYKSDYATMLNWFRKDGIQPISRPEPQAASEAWRDDLVNKEYAS